MDALRLEQHLYNFTKRPWGGGDGVLEFYHDHCGSAMEAAELFLAETRVCGIQCHWRIRCALPAKK